jgi:hypothetical protein
MIDSMIGQRVCRVVWLIESYDERKRRWIVERWYTAGGRAYKYRDSMLSSGLRCRVRRFSESSSSGGRRHGKAG